MKIGVIGLGSMGAAMASRLLAAGHEVTVYNRTQSKAAPLQKQGARLAKTPFEAAQGDAFITMLMDDAALEDVIFGTTDDGVAYKQNEKAIHLSMSTISPKLSGRINDLYSSRGQRYIAAPVLGRPDVVERGELVIMTAGDSKVIKECGPIFDALSAKVYVMGENPVQAHTAKVTANFMISAMLETFGEALALVTKAGVNPQMFYEMVSFDFFKSPVYQKYGKIIVEQKFDGGAVSLKMQAKDTRLAADCARELECPMPFLSVLQDTFLSALARGKGDLDPCAITEIIAENAGINRK